MRLAPLAILLLAARPMLAQSDDPVSRLGRYVETYYARAQSLVTEETVVVQPLASDLTGVGFPRRAVYELRVEWDPAAPSADERAVVVRHLIKASGPALFESGEEECADPPSITPEPLGFLLPDSRDDWAFTMRRPGRVDGRPAMVLEYTRRESHPPRVIQDNDCLFTDLSGQTAGRLWADPDTAEIFRMDERLVGMVDVKIPKPLQKKGRPTDITYERMQSSVRYRRVAFTDPDEQLLLPRSIETLQVHRSNSGVSRLRVTQTFEKYRRFVTSSRLLE